MADALIANPNQKSDLEFFNPIFGFLIFPLKNKGKLNINLSLFCFNNIV